MNKRLLDIHRKNAEFEKDSPYNFCDRWCERCPSATQLRCKVYQDQLEQKMTCIAHGKDEDDLEITKAVMEQQWEDDFKEPSEEFQKLIEEAEVEAEKVENIEAFEAEERRNEIDMLQSSSLTQSAQDYHQLAHEFLNLTYFKENRAAQPAYDFETIVWYHTLLPVKLRRALSGFYEARDEDDFSLCDAVAQFEICKKAVSESTKALRNIEKQFSSDSLKISRMLALLESVQREIDALFERL